MMQNLDINQDKWSKLLQAEAAHATRSEAEATEESEIPEHVLEDSDTISIGVAKIAAKVARHEDRLAANSMRTRPAVRFDPHTTVTAASDSEQSEDGELSPETAATKTIGSEFLGIPRPDGRRHSIATGLMPIPSAQLLNAAAGGYGGSSLSTCRSSSSLNVSEMVSSPTTRTVGRTVIRRESLPSGNLLAGRALPSKTILHLQKLSSKGESSSGEVSPAESTTAVASTSAGGTTEIGSPIADIPPSPARLAERSSCSSSTTDEILDFTFSLPEPGSRSSGSPRRSTLEATDVDELCPGTSILSMSPNVAHFTLQQSIEIEDQRRHLIRQQTCPVVSIYGEGTGKFDRPRFLSAAAAVSPTQVASSSIISQHRGKNKSPETGSGGSSGGEEGAVGGAPMGHGRGSGGSSSEAIMACGVISEEGDRASGGSSAEASPLEIFVQQFPPGADDNDGEAPRRTSSTGNLDSDQNCDPELGCCCTSSSSENCLLMKSYQSSFTNYQDHSENVEMSRAEVSSVSAPGNNLQDSSTQEPSSSCNLVGESNFREKTHFHEIQQSGKCYRGVGEGSSCFNDNHDVDADEHGLKDEASKDQLNRNVTDIVNTQGMTRTQPPSTFTTGELGAEKNSVGSSPTQDISTQTESLLEKENSEPGPDLGLEEDILPQHLVPDGATSSECGSTAVEISHTATNTMSTSRGTSTNSASSSSSGSSSANMNRLATLLMWKNNRLWKSLTEEDQEENPCISDLDLEENLSPTSFYDRWNVRLTTTQPTHQGIVGARLQIRRGSAPTTTPTLACRGAQDRRSDPTQYHSSYIHCFEKNNNPGDLVGGSAYAKHAQLRRGSVPVDLMRQTMLRPILTSSNSNKSQIPKTGRRGSLPTDTTVSGEASFAYKWMHVFPYSEDDSVISMKRRSSGGPELFAAAQQKMSSTVTNVRTWKAQILIEQMSSSAAAATSACGFWPGRRRGSLPVDVYIASSGSCSSESESSAGDTSDT
ncbi:hypothetical protein Ocin01_10928 [Orchesella cincta]|uniref:Uncharacterized protein n=1 Tax=Orchesella cincta TaxID=48709 RepID=A0A1D2MRX4_ORCCI|nr:hypothetical protein Ocin01_10928 [Orchesella cincta]